MDKVLKSDILIREFTRCEEIVFDVTPIRLTSGIKEAILKSKA